MSELKILHAADLHLDSPFEGLGAAKAARRREEQRRLLYRIAQLAETEQVDLVLLAGDLLDSDSTYAETGEALAEALGSISAPVFISPGNHDFYSPRSPYAHVRFPEMCTFSKAPPLSALSFRSSVQESGVRRSAIIIRPPCCTAFPHRKAPE